MTLLAAWQQIDVGLEALAQEFRNFAAAKPQLTSSAQFSLLDECLLEGLLSRVWQSWGHFCRTCVVESCLGTVTANGVAVPALPGATSEAHVSAAALHIKNKKNGTCWTGAANNILRAEPTWGDTGVLNTHIAVLLPGNSVQLQAGFSAAHLWAKALQTIRNGAAHNNKETRADINAMQSSYIVFSITHPTQALFWIDPKTNDFLITAAIDELKDCALTAIS